MSIPQFELVARMGLIGLFWAVILPSASTALGMPLMFAATAAGAHPGALGPVGRAVGHAAGAALGGFAA